jgi:hypothetical protein
VVVLETTTPFFIQMKKILLITLALISLIAIIGCNEPPSEAYSATEKIKALPPEEQFDLIKDNPGLNLPMKERAIEALKTTEEQKQKWLEEVRSQSGQR